MLREDEDLAFCHRLTGRPMFFTLGPRSRHAAANEFIHIKQNKASKTEALDLCQERQGLA